MVHYGVCYGSHYYVVDVMQPLPTGLSKLWFTVDQDGCSTVASVLQAVFLQGKVSELRSHCRAENRVTASQYLRIYALLCLLLLHHSFHFPFPPQISSSFPFSFLSATRSIPA